MSRKLLLAFSAVVTILLSNAFAGDLPKPKLVYPMGNESFRPGQSVKIRWKVANADAARFCEQEIYMIVGKQAFLISPELGPQERSYRWIVPNIPGRAVLELRLGCDVVSIFETKNIENGHAFQIMATN